MIEIVPYEPKYADQLLALAHDIHSTSVYARFGEVDEAKLLRQLGASADLVPDRWFRLAVEDGEVLGAFYGIVFPTFFNALKIAKDMGQWTKRGHAKNSWSLLVSAFNEWAVTQGAEVSGLGYSVEVENIEQMRRIAEFQGYRVVGYNLMKELHHG